MSNNGLPHSVSAIRDVGLIKSSLSLPCLQYLNAVAYNYAYNCDFERKEILVIAVSRPLFPNKFQCIMFVCLCLTSHRQRGHSETAPPFTVPCEGREAR